MSERFDPTGKALLGVVEIPNKHAVESLNAITGIAQKASDATGEPLYLVDQDQQMVGEIRPISSEGYKALARTSHTLGSGVNDKRWEDIFGHTGFVGNSPPVLQ